MMWILGAKRQPRTTEPLRLTEMHMVVVCTCEEKGVCDDEYVSLHLDFFLLSSKN